MSRKSRLNIRFVDSRVLLSEVLPYEIPVTFNNNALHSFFVHNSAKFYSDKITLESKDPNVFVILRIIFGDFIQPGQQVSDNKVQYTIGRRALNEPTVPFHFNVRHKIDEYRQLSIPHPSSQIAAASFYRTYRSLILLHSNRSSFSVRHPFKSARYTIVRDSVFNDKKDSGHYGIEERSAEYDRLRSYFVYDRYSNIHKFYESNEYRDSEKKFGHLLRLDIQKCFDSIYTHSIEWAIYGKQTVKAARHEHGTAFAAKFDQLIQGMNDAETHGILIGPEISRIFAEIILQTIDLSIEQKLAKLGMIHYQDYEILRYVDDFFIFMRDPNQHTSIVPIIESCLKPFRFHLNRSKEVIYSTPFISNLSIAKNRISSSVKSLLRLRGIPNEAGINLFFESSSNQLITDYKTVLRDTDLGPLDAANYTLSELERRLESVLEWVNPLPWNAAGSNLLANRANLGRLLMSTIEFAYYVYGGSPRVTPGIKLARISALCRRAVVELGLSTDIGHSVDDLIYRETLLQLNRNRLTEECSVEALYLLTILGSLDKYYILSEDALCDFVGISRNSSGLWVIPNWFNPLVVGELLRYFATDVSKFQTIRSALEAWLVSKIESLRLSGRRTSEEVLFTLNTISCPLVSEETKWKILRRYNVKTKSQAKDLHSVQNRWFTHWGEIDLLKELQAKRVQEVY